MTTTRWSGRGAGADAEPDKGDDGHAPAAGDWHNRSGTGTAPPSTIGGHGAVVQPAGGAGDAVPRAPACMHGICTLHAAAECSSTGAAPAQVPSPAPTPHSQPAGAVQAEAARPGNVCAPGATSAAPTQAMRQCTAGETLRVDTGRAQTGGTTAPGGASPGPTTCTCGGTPGAKAAAFAAAAEVQKGAMPANASAMVAAGGASPAIVLGAQLAAFGGQLSGVRGAAVELLAGTMGSAPRPSWPERWLAASTDIGRARRSRVGRSPAPQAASSRPARALRALWSERSSFSSARAWHSLSIRRQWDTAGRMGFTPKRCLDSSLRAHSRPPMIWSTAGT
mmetsp:Transcript_57673/g.163767  ORF Transcript_57673/g.163767 Transcript_57673/m.163767 type:complete len:336 (+) Transcript_57673:1654-2661(+)